MQFIYHNTKVSPLGMQAICDLVASGNHKVVFLTGMDASGKSSLVQVLDSTYNNGGSGYRKVPIYYQKDIAKDFHISLDEKLALQEKQQEIMLHRYEEQIQQDLQQMNNLILIYDRTLLDLIAPWSLTTHKTLDDFQDLIIEYLQQYPDFLYIITMADKNTVHDRIKARGDLSDSDVKLLKDIEENNGSEVFDVFLEANLSFAKYIDNLILEGKLSGTVAVVDTSD